MSTKRAKEIRDLSAQELEATLLDTQKLLYALRCEQKKAKQIEKPHRIRQFKKEIARLLTLMREKQLSA